MTTAPRLKTEGRSLQPQFPHRSQGITVGFPESELWPHGAERGQFPSGASHDLKQAKRFPPWAEKQFVLRCQQDADVGTLHIIHREPDKVLVASE